MPTNRAFSELRNDKTANPSRTYECGPLRFDDEDYYDRHVVFDHVVSLETASERDRFEAMARSIRDVLAQRWVSTERSYDHQNPKEVYYLSMEFLIGRTMANAITNLQIDEFVESDFASDIGQDLQALFEAEPDAGWATAGWAAWRPVFSTHWPRSRSRPSATACATNTECSARRSRTAARSSIRTTG